MLTVLESRAHIAYYEIQGLYTCKDRLIVPVLETYLVI